MTQFVLLKTSIPYLGIKPAEYDSDDFTDIVRSRYFPESKADLYVFDIDRLMLDAQISVLKSISFEDTELFKTISSTPSSVEEIVFWYGSDYDDLDCVHDLPSLISNLQGSVRASSCEAYIHYKNARKATLNQQM